MARIEKDRLRFCLWATLLSLMLTCSVQVFAAEDCAISGSVVSASRGPLPDVDVLITRCEDQDAPGCPEPEVIRTLRSSQKGAFHAGALPRGLYMVEASAPGWMSRSTQVFALESGQSVEMEIRLMSTPDDIVIRYPNATAADLQRFDKALRLMGEPGFCQTEMPAKVESYRFLWLRTFDRPVLFNLKIVDGKQATVHYKEADGQAGYEFGRVVVDEIIDLNARLRSTGSDSEMVWRVWEHFSDEAESLFWNQPFEVEDGSIQLDGAVWTVEGRRNGKCHVVTRWSPERVSPLRRLVDSLISLSGKRFYYDEVY